MDKLTKQFGKPICVLLYAVFAALAAKKKPWPLAILFAMHAAEYVLVGRKVAEEAGLSRAEGLAGWRSALPSASPGGCRSKSTGSKSIA